jgi:hypothetical protein
MGVAQDATLSRKLGFHLLRASQLGTHTLFDYSLNMEGLEELGQLLHGQTTVVIIQKFTFGDKCKSRSGSY